MFTDEEVTIKQELEVAMAVGREKAFKLLFIEFDRIGVGYRVGNNLQGIRLFVSSIFE
jgi:hypothetical protein